MKIFFDTNILVAACIEDHVHHSLAFQLLNSIRSRQSEGFASGHGLLEAYSTMTRMPRSPALEPSVAMKLLDENVVKQLTLTALTGREFAQLVTKLAIEGTRGGQVYDALHLACAEKCQADRIYTFNVGHFKAVAPVALREKILSP